MSYRSLRLTNFRSYRQSSLLLHDGVTIIAGPNGSGKTNILEALYVLNTGSSFRVADKDLMQHGQTWWRLEADYGDIKRSVAYDSTLTKQQKHFSIDGLKRFRLHYDQRLPVVLFEPEHLRLLHGGPAGRRDYMDGLLSHLQPDYSRIRSRFERVLQQRNNLLKDALRLHIPSTQLEDQLFVWDISFADLSQTIVERRRELVAAIDSQLTDIYGRIVGRKTATAIQYITDAALQDDYKTRLVTALRTRHTVDVARGFTTIGPHRDDFAIDLDGANASTTASRGEMRTLILALKIIETELFADRHRHPPLLLFDDVFSELDSSRRSALAQLAQRFQTIITTTDADNVVAHMDHKSIIVTPLI